MFDLAMASTYNTIAIDKAVEELYAASRSYKGCPKLVEPYWIKDSYLDRQAIVLPLFSGGTEVAASPLTSNTDWLNIKHYEAPLALYPDADGYVNSAEVMRAFSTYLTTLTGYLSSIVDSPFLQVHLQDAEKPLNLLLTIPVDNRQQSRIYYLVADGNGNWKRVAPKLLEVV